MFSYTAFNSAECLKDTVGTDAYRLDIMYGPDQQRWKSVLKKNGTDVKTIIFAGDYEKFIDNGITKELYYIGAGDGLAAVYVKPQSGAASMYYAHTDHLGSIVSLTDSAGTAVFNASYDACSVKLGFCERSETKTVVERIPISEPVREGRQTVGLNTIGFYRGYTGHEHLPEFGLINMNGRMLLPMEKITKLRVYGLRVCVGADLCVCPDMEMENMNRKQDGHTGRPPAKINNIKTVHLIIHFYTFRSNISSARKAINHSIFTFKQHIEYLRIFSSKQNRL